MFYPLLYIRYCYYYYPFDVDISHNFGIMPAIKDYSLELDTKIDETWNFATFSTFLHES